MNILIVEKSGMANSIISMIDKLSLALYNVRYPRLVSVFHLHTSGRITQHRRSNTCGIAPFRMARYKNDSAIRVVGSTHSDQPGPRSQEQYIVYIFWF